MNNWGGRWGRLRVRGSCWMAQHLNRTRDSLPGTGSRVSAAVWQIWMMTETIMAQNFLSRWVLKRHDEMWCTFKVGTVIIFTKCQFHEIVALVKGGVRQTEMRTEPESVGWCWLLTHQACRAYPIPPLPPACVCMCAALLLSSTCTGIMRAPGKHYGKATTLTDL